MLISPSDKVRAVAQVPTSELCPKKESRAWDYEEKQCANLSEAIEFLLEEKAAGFTLYDHKDRVIVSKQVTYYGG